jgi:hypothetical protein
MFILPFSTLEKIPVFTAARIRKAPPRLARGRRERELLLSAGMTVDPNQAQRNPFSDIGPMHDESRAEDSRLSGFDINGTLRYRACD